QMMKVINESGLYSAILKSKKPQAKAFKKWVTSEVLPSIRKHGAYMTDQVLEQAVTNPDFMIGLLTNLKEEKAKRVEAERTILQQQPLVTFA
ncbi:BRO-N domain-containing protein, partial [Vibrio cholerae]|uniref:BRO-N domain-containing protein n=3 Tax=Bacteria TaxID=2 RepID=UPI00209F6E14